MNRQYFLSLLTAMLLSMPMQLLAQTAGRAYLGYAKYDDQIWEYDGLSLDHNAKVGCAILLTADMLKPYIGGTIVGMRVGWDTSQQNGSYEGFVRNTFNGENLSTGKVTVKLGWNNMTMTDYVIPADVQQLVVGFTTTLKKDVVAIPLFSYYNTPNSCYLWVEGDNDANGNPNWANAQGRGSLPILLTIKDTEGTFSYLPVIQSLVDDGVVSTGAASTTLMRIKNIGAQTIKSLEFTSRFGQETYKQTVTLSKTIPQTLTSSAFMAPLYCFGTGDVELSITKVNDKDVANPPTQTVNLIGIPTEVSKNYKRRPLVEYFESENNYRSARYWDEIIEPTVQDKLSKLTVVCQHLDDQFMTGDDDATRLCLQLCDNDSDKVSIPSMSVDRGMSTDNILYQQNAAWDATFPSLYDPYASQVFNAAMKHPTFVAVQATGNLGSDQETLDVIINGDVAAGILPEGEQPRLTVYLMERFVKSDSQLFWTDQEKEASMGQYVHFNVIREVLSAPEGDPITAGGEFNATYTTQADPTWDAENLYVVAFVHRDGQKGGKRMHVFNSAESFIDLTNSIQMPTAQQATAGAATVYDLSGRALRQPASGMRQSSLPKGIYIINGKKVVR